MRLDKFIDNIKSEFPDDRLTWQKGVPTFHPENGSEAAGIFKLARSENQQLFVGGFGNNIVPVGRKFENMVVVKSDRLNNIFRVVADDFYVTVGAGYPLRELNKALSEYQLFLPHGDLPYVGSVGGALAVGLSADRDGHDSPLSRYLIKGEIALPDGKIITPGSACFKSVAGFDIVKIFSPSWGILGMIVNVTLRVLPVTARHEFDGLMQKGIDYSRFADLYFNPGDSQEAIYSKKIKDKFDPDHILPLIRFQ